MPYVETEIINNTGTNMSTLICKLQQEIKIDKKKPQYHSILGNKFIDLFWSTT